MRAFRRRVRDNQGSASRVELELEMNECDQETGLAALRSIRRHQGHRVKQRRSF